MPCSVVSSLASSTRLPVYFTMRITFLPILKFRNPSRTSLVRCSLYNLNRIGDIWHPCLTPLSIFILIDFPWSSLILTLWSVYNLLINLLSRQSIPVFLTICINLVQFTRPSLRNNHLSPKFVLILFSASHLHPSFFSSSKSKMSFYKYSLHFRLNSSSKYLHYYLCCVSNDADCAMVAAFCSF